jgi:hypothetical protein
MRLRLYGLCDWESPSQNQETRLAESTEQNPKQNQKRPEPNARWIIADSRCDSPTRRLVPTAQSPVYTSSRRPFSSVGTGSRWRAGCRAACRRAPGGRFWALYAEHDALQCGVGGDRRDWRAGGVRERWQRGLSLSLPAMARHDYPPGAFTAPATQQSVQHRLNQKGMTHEMAMQELESIAYRLLSRRTPHPPPTCTRTHTPRPSLWQSSCSRLIK